VKKCFTVSEVGFIRDWKLIIGSSFLFVAVYPFAYTIEFLVIGKDRRSVPLFSEDGFIWDLDVFCFIFLLFFLGELSKGSVGLVSVTGVEK